QAYDPRADRPGAIVLSANNNGDVAGATALTGTLTAPLRYLSLDPGDWSCTVPAVNTLAPVIHCTRPSLAAYTGRAVTVTVAPGGAPVDVPLTVTVSTVSPEASLDNNTETGEVQFWAHSANGNPWDLEPNDGSLDDGGQDAFDGFGGLRVQVYNGATKL